MNFSDSLKAPEVKKPDIGNSLEEWPKHYYEEVDPSMRLAMLNAAIEAGLDPEKDPIRKEIFNLRYKPNKNAENGYADMFVRVFMEFNMDSKNTTTTFGMGRAKKKILKELKSIGLGDEREKTEPYKSVLLDEFIHLGQLYIVLSSTSKQYTAKFLGFGRLSDEKLIQKLYTDLSDGGINIINRYDVYEELKLWVLGLDEARARMLPTTDPFLC